MLSYEERKAIKTIKDFKDLKRYEDAFDNGTEILDEEEKQDIKIVLNLIEKQQKEIEKLKDMKKELTERVLRLESDKFWDNVVSKDKIKAKIESVDYGDYSKAERIAMKEVLQSLLEKE